MRPKVASHCLPIGGSRSARLHERAICLHTYLIYASAHPPTTHPPAHKSPLNPVTDPIRIRDATLPSENRAGGCVSCPVRARGPFGGPRPVVRGARANETRHTSTSPPPPSLSESLSRFLDDLSASDHGNDVRRAPKRSRRRRVLLLVRACHRLGHARGRHHQMEPPAYLLPPPARLAVSCTSTVRCPRTSSLVLVESY